jgi:uncharacterized protein (DUF2141 family)
MRILLIGAIALLVAACASIGRPEGGPRDENPPVYVRANPAPGSVNVDRQKIDIWFDENIKLEDQSNKVVVSPVQKENARVSANGRHLTIEFKDTLVDSTTYVVDFSDAIRDLNEGNILDGFAYDFSTGSQIDTLTISGMLFQARNLEPAQSMVVGVYSNLSDTAIRTLPLERVSKTNQYGQFTIRGLKPGSYNIFAINDRNHDWHWDRSEDIAFYPLTISPSTVPIEVTDTLRSSLGEDSIVVRQAWHYLPDDLLMTWFNEDYRSQYLRDNKRPAQRYIELKFGAPVDTLPELTIINGNFAGRRLDDLSVMETRQERDSLIYWLRDSALVQQDSILLSARYHKTDSLDRLVWQTDTLKMFYRRPKVKEEKKKPKNEADSLANDSLPQIKFLELKATTSNQQELNLPVRFEAPEPLLPISDDAWRLEVQNDTLWTRVRDAKLMPDSTTPRALLLTAKWTEGTKYRFTADSASISNIYGEFIKPFQHEFTTKKLDEYGNIYLNLTDLQLLSLPDTAQVVVELLASGDKVVATAIVKRGTATFNYVAPSTYYARAYIDVNGDGEWTTGNYNDRRLPEDVFYYPKKLLLRKNWDIEQDWALLDTPVDLQKPNDIKQNKPKTKETQKKDTTDEDNDEEEDEYGTSWGNGSQYNNASSKRSSSTSSFGRGMATQRQY